MRFRFTVYSSQFAVYCCYEFNNLTASGLPIVYCLLPIVYCLLSIANCYLLARSVHLLNDFNNLQAFKCIGGDGCTAFQNVNYVFKYVVVIRG